MKRSFKVGNRMFRHHKLCETIPGQILRSIQHHNIDFVFDIGANKGQYAKELFIMGYEGKIVSIEPVKESFKLLLKEVEVGKIRGWNWGVYPRCAVGKINNTDFINVADHLELSSFMNYNPTENIGRLKLNYVDREEVDVKCFDNIFNKFYKAKDNLKYFLKLDVEGYEGEIFEGMKSSWDKLGGIQVEVILTKLWKKGKSYDKIIKLIESKGFKLFAIHSIANQEETGKTLALDLIFFKDWGKNKIK